MKADPAPTRKVRIQPIEAAALPGALLDKRTVGAVTGLSVATIYRKMAAGQFPAAVRFGARCTRWQSSKVAAWVAGNPADKAGGAL